LTVDPGHTTDNRRQASG